MSDQNEARVAQSSNAVIGSTLSPRRLHLKLIGLVISVIVIVGAIWLGAYIVISKSQKNTSKSNLATSTNDSSPALTPTQWATKAELSGDYTGAQDILKNAISKTKNPQTKAGLYKQLSSIALDGQDYTGAMQYALSVEKLAPTAGSANLVGQAAMHVGDKQTAQVYFQKAIDRLNPKADGYNLTLGSYKSELQAAKS